MSQYIHEVVLHEYILENIQTLELNIRHNNTSHRLIDARANKTGTFWDLEGKLDTGIWIPVEVEWKSDNFLSHGHHKSKHFKDFCKTGTLLVLRRNREIDKVNQISILEYVPQEKFKAHFKKWFKNKSHDYSLKTLDNFLIGNYTRKIPRILVIPISNNARKNYFSKEPLYRKNEKDPLLLGFKQSGVDNNEFVKDIQPGDICLFIDADGKRTTRKKFIGNIIKQRNTVYRIAAFKIESKLFDIPDSPYKVDEYFWPDEIKKKKVIYPQRCKLSNYPFFEIKNKKLPYVTSFTESNWEQLRGCIQYGIYYEISSMDFTLLISNIK
jgi:hypothetical protein